jgi:hypothetical protein
MTRAPSDPEGNEQDHEDLLLARLQCDKRMAPVGPPGTAHLGEVSDSDVPDLRCCTNGADCLDDTPLISDFRHNLSIMLV